MFTEEYYWLPAGVTWTKLEDYAKSASANVIPHSSDLVLAIPLSILLTLGRFGFESVISVTLSNKLNVKKGKQFSESVWRLVIYILMSLLGTWCLYNAKWRESDGELWADYPYQPLEDNIQVYYMVELALYLSLMCTLFIDTKRKDFTEQVVHHIATISLITLSYISNFTRVGAIVMWYHDISDVFLELAKSSKYAGYTRLTEVNFVIFMVVFAISRLVYYPKLVYQTCIMSVPFQPFPFYTVIIVFLIVLQLLHVMWFYTICAIVKKALAGGEVKDERSDDEDDEENDQKLKSR